MTPVAMLTDTAVINDIRIGDRSVELIGYVDRLESRITVGTKTPTMIQRFVLNNGEGRRIQCIAWGREAATRVAALIRLNVILHVDGAEARIPRYDRNGNVPLELRIEESTTVTELGEYPQETITAEIEDEQIPLVNLDDVANTTGRIRVHAFLKSPFRIITSNNSSYTIGVITDGFFKLEVQRAVCTPIDIERGESVEVTGTIREDPVLHLKLRDDSDIKKRNDGERMTAAELLGISKLPQKKNKRARLE